MHSLQLRSEARRLFRNGWPQKRIAVHLGLARSTVRYWCTGKLPTDNPQRRTGRCPRCRTPTGLPERERDYAYLLGQYLGDRHLVMTARVPVLRISCASTYPDIMDEVENAMLATLATSVCRVRRTGCYQVCAYSTHWPCLFPQHGPGMKHHRHIELADWQQEIVARQPRALLRGLIQADGSRPTNVITKNGRRYTYPRYFFVNESPDILAICGQTLDRVGAEWRFNRRNSISVAKRASVALLDEFIGPKS